MKNNELLEKYGEKALQVYKKTIKANDENHPSSSHQIPLTKISKSSKKNLHHSKSKSKIPSLDPSHTFNKIPYQDNGKKKLLLSGLSTPKNKTLRGVQKEERNQSTSTKKKQTNEKITEKLHNALYNKKSTKSMIKSAMECLDIICEEENKVSKWLNHFREIMLKIGEELYESKKKCKSMNAKNKSLQTEISELKEKAGCQYESVKKKSLEGSMSWENENLRKEIRQLKQKICNYERKELVLIGAIEQLKVRKVSREQKQKERNKVKYKNDFYQELENDEESEQQSYQN